LSLVFRQNLKFANSIRIGQRAVCSKRLKTKQIAAGSKKQWKVESGKEKKKLKAK